MFKKFAGLLAALLLLIGTANAKPLYQFIWAGPGDVTSMTALNDLGQVLFFSGQLCDGQACSFIRTLDRNTGSFGANQTYLGLPLPWAPGGTEVGTIINQFNSAGDMVGLSGGIGGIPTFWRNGIAYDMTDPANGGLIFVPDAGVGQGTLDLSTLTIVNPDEIGMAPLDLAAFLVSTIGTWHNALGDHAFMITYPGIPGETGFLMPLSVPAPATLSLVALALLGMAGLQRIRPCTRAQP